MARSSGSDLRRKNTGSKKPKTRFFIFCEDKLMSPDFFKRLADLYPSELIEIVASGGEGVPETITKKCKLKRDEVRRSGTSRHYRDEIWAVFDRDEHERFDESIEECREAGIFLSTANPCFETWMLLFKGTYDKGCSRHDCQADLRKKFREYDPKSKKTIDMRVLTEEELIEMEVRALRRHEARVSEGSPFGPPSDTVFCLSYIIRAEGRRRKGGRIDRDLLDRHRNIARRKP